MKTHFCVKKLDKRYGHHWEFSRVLPPAPPFITPGMMTARLEANHSIIQVCVWFGGPLLPNPREIDFDGMSHSHLTERHAPRFCQCMKPEKSGILKDMHLLLKLPMS